VTRLRLLALAPFPPRLDATHGGSHAVAELLARLGARHQVALLALRGEDEPPLDDALRTACDVAIEVPRPGRAAAGLEGDVRVALALGRGTPMWVSRWAVPGFRQAVRELAGRWRPDVVQAEYHLMAQYFEATGTSAPRVLRQLEPGAATAGERGAVRRGLTRALTAADAWAWRRYESRAMRAADVVATLTEQDTRRLAPLAGTTPLVAIPLGVSIPPQAADPRGRDGDTVLFVGNFVHPPNLDAAERLLGAIFPRVRAAVPGAMLRIVGPNPGPALRDAAAPGVTITGEVPRVWDHLEGAAVVVAPMRLGGGMRVKVAEALAAGKAVVATPLAVEGLAVTDGDQLRIADSDDALAAAVIELLRFPDRRIALARRARGWAESELGWDRPVAAYERLYRSLLEGRRR
jgi:glycosyltransferase involved in cell wall biosynthesis